MTKLHDLAAAGQSPWLDNLRRDWIADGELARWVERGVAGVTSNPSIFQKAIAGAEVYTGNGCSGCHGPTGGGGSGRPFADCAVVKTFPYIENQLEFVKLGSAGFTGQPYGDPNREGGAHIGGDFGQMPAFGATLTDAELLEVVRHEREVLSGEVVPEDQIDTGSPTEERLWPNGEPMLDSAGVLIDPEGEPLFDDAGKLANPEASISAGGEPAVCE